jgi:transitional endoplasmic reticulum ATPase
MSDSEPFTFVTCSQKNALFNDFKHFTSAKVDDVDAQLIDALRTKFPEMTVTAVPSYNVNLLQFAAAGYAQAHLDTETDSKISWRGYMPPFERGGLGSIAEVVFFAKYHYKWGTEDYILYTVAVGFLDMQYILKEPDSGESTLSNSAKTDALIAAIGEAMQGVGKSILVYDGYWFDSTELWNEVQKVSWDDVILEQETKKELTEISEKFFSSKCSFDGLMNTVVYLFEDKQAYEDLGVPWKVHATLWAPCDSSS